jgi:pentapeptide MXKDX repeat protein
MNKILLTITLGLLLGNTTNAQQHDSAKADTVKRDAVKKDAVKKDAVKKKTLKTKTVQDSLRVNRHPKFKKQRQLQQLHDSLNLTPAQKVAFKEINTAFKAKSDSLRSDSTLNPESRKAARKQLMSDRQRQLSATLTTEQQQKFREQQQRRMKFQRSKRMQATGNQPGRMKAHHQPKADQKPNSTLQNTYWKLSKINGKQVITPENMKEIHIMFANDGKSFKGFAGCNGLGGDYKLGDHQSITISAISTKMYCERMADENFLTNAISKAGRYRIKGEKLLLFQGKELLASFDAVYL